MPVGSHAVDAHLCLSRPCLPQLNQSEWVEKHVLLMAARMFRRPSACHASASSRALASCRSAVSNPSVNQL
jgi:hypothetical protein